MPLFRGRQTVEELDNRLEYAKIENEVLTEEAEAEEKKAIIAELKRKYGSGWRSILGVNKLTDIQSLRSFLKGAKQGMERATSQGGSPLSTTLNPANFRGVRKA